MDLVLGKFPQGRETVGRGWCLSHINSFLREFAYLPSWICTSPRGKGVLRDRVGGEGYWGKTSPAVGESAYGACPGQGAGLLQEGAQTSPLRGLGEGPSVGLRSPRGFRGTQALFCPGSPRHVWQRSGSKEQTFLSTKRNFVFEFLKDKYLWYQVAKIFRFHWLLLKDL